ncbi:MAG: serine hydrolase domain-containing protein [Panacagrimonas sp.]
MHYPLLLASLMLTAVPVADALATPIEATAQRVERVRQERGIAAAAVVLVDGDAPALVRAFGVSDWISGAPVTADTRFRVGSITKTFTALALLRAQSQKLLRLDQPVRQIAPTASFENPWEKTHPLRVEHLLEGTAGWFDMSMAEFDSADPRPLTLDQALALRPASRLSHWPPGTQHEYSNSGAGLAAWVLERACGCDFENFLRRQVFEPLGMHSASLRADSETLKHLAQGYERDAHKPLPYWHILYRPAGGLNLKPADMAPMLRMLINRGRLNGKSFLVPAEIERLERPRGTLGAQHGLEFGYALALHRDPHRGHALLGHGGDADGYLSRFSYSPDSRRGYFVVITAFNGAAMDELQALLDDWLVEPLPKPAAPPLAALRPEQLERFAGEYRAASTRFPGPDWEAQTLRVLMRDGGLFTELPGQAAVALLPVDAHRFRRERESVATSVFIAQPDTTMQLQGPMGNWRRAASGHQK